MQDIHFSHETDDFQHVSNVTGLKVEDFLENNKPLLGSSNSIMLRFAQNEGRVIIDIKESIPGRYEIITELSFMLCLDKAANDIANEINY